MLFYNFLSKLLHWDDTYRLIWDIPSHKLTHDTVIILSVSQLDNLVKTLTKKHRYIHSDYLCDLSMPTFRGLYLYPTVKLKSERIYNRDYRKLRQSKVNMLDIRIK